MVKSRFSRAFPLLLSASTGLVACGSPAPVIGKSLVPLPTFSEDAGSARDYHPRVASLSHALGSVPEDTIGPVLARTRSGYVTVHARPKPGRGRALLASLLDGGAHAVGSPKYVADVEDDLTLLTATGVGTRAGAMVAYATVLDRGEAVTAVGLTEAGGPAGAPVQLARTENHIRALRLFPTTQGTLCLWAEQPTDGDVEILAVTLTASGYPRGVPVKVASQVGAFQAISAGDNIALALVHEDETHTGSRVEWTVLGSDNQPARPLTVIARMPARVLDIDIIRETDAPVFHVAWTGLSGGEPAVFVSTFTEATGSQIATAVLPSPSHLTQLVAGGSGAAVAWDDSLRGVSKGRIELAPIDRSGAIDQLKQTEITVKDGSRAEFAGTATGYGVTAVAETCTSESACAIGPMFMRLDRDLHPTQIERLSLGDESSIHASRAWGLLCGDKDCVVLIAGGREPTFVSAADLSVRPTSLSGPMRAAMASVGPRMGTMHPVFEGGRYSDVVAADLGTTVLIGAMDDLHPSLVLAAKTKRSDITSRVIVRPVDETGKPKGETALVTAHAMLNAGIAMAAATDPEHGAVVAWIGRDKLDGAVHLTRVDKSGVRRSEVLLAPARSDAPSVSVAAYGDGWLVAWTDSRTNNVEVYIARVNRSLERVSQIEQLTRGGRDVSDLSIAVSSEHALVAWSDARDNPAFALADIYVAPVNPATAKRTGADVRLLPTAAHSRSPQLIAFPTGFASAWIEDPPSGIATADSLSQGVMLARLTESGTPRSPPLRLGLAGDGAPAAFAATASGGDIRLVVARSRPEHESLDILIEPFEQTGHPASSVLIPFGGDSAFTRGLALSRQVCGFVHAGRDGHPEAVQIGSISWGATISSNPTP